jgi:hypothetical protein
MAMAKCIPAMGGQYLNHHNFRTPRNQRDAGLEFFGWEKRLRPRRPLLHDLCFAGALLLTAAATFTGYVFF